MAFKRFIHFTVIACCCYCLVTSTTQSDDVTVTTPDGKITGKRRVDKFTVNNAIGKGIDTVDVFTGVPYAEPPVGDLRFAPPKPKSSWSGIHDATKKPTVCPVIIFGSNYEQSEDCLYLNVYSPFQKTSPSAKYPVMLYIHGGSYLAGSANDYDGHILARYGIVVVIINYRLGTFGFFTTGDDDLPGNYGIQDQQMALTWVSKNIQAFRGDPKQVTIFGNSAGGSSVGIHLLSPLSKGLFQRAIVQSGPITNTHWAHHKATPAELRKHTLKVAKVANCTQESMSDIIKCMRKLSWKQLKDLELPPLYWTPETMIPVVDKNVIPDKVDKLLAEGKVNKVPVIIGLTVDECAGMLPLMIPMDIGKGFDLNVGFDESQYNKTVEYDVLKVFAMANTSNFVNEVKFEYTDHKISPTADKRKSRRYQILQMCSDLQMTAPTMALAKALVNIEFDIYMYVFDQHVISLPPLPEYLVKTSFHQSELPFVFGAQYFSAGDPLFPWKLDYPTFDKTLTVYMITLWSDFAKFGYPKTKVNTITWPKYDNATSQYLYVSNGFEVRSSFKARRVAFWNDYVPYQPFPPKQRTFQIELIIVSVVAMVLLIVVLVLSCAICDQRQKPKAQMQKREIQGVDNMAMEM